nr:MAG TPA: hypothetical protein [Bacteriophage sp.]
MSTTFLWTFVSRICTILSPTVGRHIVRCSIYYILYILCFTLIDCIFD